jgi:hypothetical protein
MEMEKERSEKMSRVNFFAWSGHLGRFLPWVKGNVEHSCECSTLGPIVRVRSGILNGTRKNFLWTIGGSLNPLVRL